MFGELYAPQSADSASPIDSDFHAPAAHQSHTGGPASDAAFSERIWNEACKRLSSPPALN